MHDPRRSGEGERALVPKRQSQTPPLEGDPRLRRVAEYYDLNTERFVRKGFRREAAAIHRRLWAPGVLTSEQALRQINLLIANWLRPAVEAAPGTAWVLDLGCGVGGTAFDLVHLLGVRVAGVTLSRVQAHQAQARLRSMDPPPECAFAVADFHCLPLPRLAHAAYAVESFSHALEPERFLSEARRSLRPGGLLVVVDDFLDEAAAGTERAWPLSREGWVRRFAEGWRLAALMSDEQAVRLASAAGWNLIRREDLTPWIRLPAAWQLWLLRWQTLIRLPGTYWESLAGGAALQVSEKKGWIRYQALVLKADG